MRDNPVVAALGRPFRLGVAGGAPPSMIGPVHRVAAAMDGRFVLVAAALSSNPGRSQREGCAIGLPAERCYGSVEEMVAGEGERADSIEVESSHCGMGHHPAVVYAVADRLAQKEGEWAPFDRSGWRSLVYPDPHR